MVITALRVVYGVKSKQTSSVGSNIKIWSARSIFYNIFVEKNCPGAVFVPPKATSKKKLICLTLYLLLGADLVGVTAFPLATVGSA